jgi:hypothetical protein
VLEFARESAATSWYDLSNMPFPVLSTKCPKTGEELLFGRDLPVEDSRYPNYIHIKSIMDFPVKVAHCPISGCGEQHTFQDSDLREVMITEPEPESIEEQSFGEFIVEIQFYRVSDDRYKVWPCLKKVGSSNSKTHFVVDVVFPTKDLARVVALRVGLDKISEGLAA